VPRTLDYSFEGRRRRLYIGGFPDWSTTAAREHAERDQGLDPFALRDERRTALFDLVLVGSCATLMSF
jgi:hypothetical protein